jgi:hypothetical protein
MVIRRFWRVTLSSSPIIPVFGHSQLCNCYWAAACEAAARQPLRGYCLQKGPYGIILSFFFLLLLLLRLLLPLLLLPLLLLALLLRLLLLLLLLCLVLPSLLNIFFAQLISNQNGCRG